MARKTLIRSTVHPYHVTARANNRESFHCPLPVVWKFFGECLAEASEQYGAKIHAFVLMPNHFHLIISTPEKDLGDIMKKMMSSSTKMMNFVSGRTGRVFGARYHWSIINTEGYFDYALKYVYRNPVKAKISSKVEDYRYSTIRDVFEKTTLPFELHPLIGHEDLIPSKSKDQFLKWLNQPFRSEIDEAIRKGFKQAEFSPKTNNWKRRKTMNFE